MTIYNQKKIFPIILFFCLILGFVMPVQAANRLFFSAMVEADEDNSEQQQVVLQWGPVNGELPSEIQKFRLYRSLNGGDNVLLTEINHTPEVVTPAAIAGLVDADLSWRKSALLETLQVISGDEASPIDEDNFADSLYTILTSADQYAPFQKMILIKRFPAVAAALGRCYIDKTVNPSSSYTYMLTAIDQNNIESGPLGRSDLINPATLSILPEPEDFSQVTLSDCDALRSGLDDGLIHFSWEVPYGPSEIARNLQTLGYDLFWAASDLGSLDLRRDGINPALHKVYQQPIMVSGPPQEGVDAYLAKDRAANHAGILPEWRRGQTYYYYLVPLDILGRYGATTGPLEATVVDAMPPRAVWGVVTREVRDPENPLSPRLALVWDRNDRANFAREYAFGKNICSADDQRICYTDLKGSCNGTSNLICEDFDVAAYHIFRYESPAEAMRGNGVDSDGDLFIDLDDVDPCDPLVPGGYPEAHVATIAAGVSEEEISPGHIQINYIDMDIGQDEEGNNNYGKVFWYRIVAVDAAANAGPVSPPIRGILYNRVQPQANAFKQLSYCTSEAVFSAPAECSITPDSDDILIFIDPEMQASRYTIWKRCSDGSFLLHGGPLMTLGITHVTNADFAAYNCKEPLPCADAGAGSYFVKFYDHEGNYLVQADISLGDLCVPEFQGCVEIIRDCQWKNSTINGGPGEVLDEGRVRICVELEDGQMARVYQDGNSANTPFAYITTDGCDFTEDSTCFSCVEIEQPQGLTATELCLGVRVFSKNHVGSTMQHLGCLEMEALPQVDQSVPLPAPMLASVDSVADVNAFDIRWAAQASAGQNFTLTYKCADASRFVVIPKTTADESHQFSYRLELAEDDLDKKWCFKLRAINTALQVSPWSNEVCAAYETLPPEAYLSWPHVSEPPFLDQALTAFYLNGATGGQDYAEPVIVLSVDLSERLTCISDLVSCPNSNPKISCLDSGLISDCRLCALARSSIIINNFIVYRRQGGGDFVQVSPLIEKLHCVTDKSGDVDIDVLDDPFIYLVNILESAVADGIDPAAVTGARLIFRDRYPHIRGTTISYKILITDPGTGEINHVLATNDIVMPE